jgi:prophage regulatory protein
LIEKLATSKCKTKVLVNNISEMQQGLSHIAEITKNISQEIPSVPTSKLYNPLSTDKLSEKPPECLIRIREVCLLVGVSRSTIYRMVDEGNFPKPLELGPRFKAWQKKTVLNWIVSHEEA